MAEPKFVPRPGQVDYSHIRYAPVLNTVVTDGKRIFLVRRSSMRLYPNYWSGVSGFLDDSGSIEDKVYEELKEELGVARADVLSILRGRPMLQEAPDYDKTWLVVPVLVKVNTIEPKINWESQSTAWVSLSGLHEYDLLPGYLEVINEFQDIVSPSQG
jgi:ADP-ribose pyrophosphatase YjhB (NUDIX family)